MTRLLAIASVLLVLGATRSEAQAPPAEPSKAPSAVELFETGKRHFDIAEYRAAITAWKQAYVLSDRPLLLFNLAQAYRLAGDCAQANRLYLNYQRVEPKPANARELGEAMSKCAGVEPAVGESTAPVLALTSRSEEQEAQAPPVATPIADPGRNLRITGIAAGIVGVAAGSVALYSALDARRSANQVARQPPGTTWNRLLDGIDRDGLAAQTRARVFTAVSVAALAGGATLWWLGRSRSRARIDVTVTPRHGEVSLSCAF
jgi:hypothetical protein